MSDPTLDQLPPFTVRAWPVNSAAAPVDTPMPSFDTALEYAYSLALDKLYRSVLVTDPFMMVWAQFNMLWSLNPAPAPR